MQEIKRKIFNYLYLILFLLLAFFIPLWKPLVPWIIGFITLFWFLEFDYKGKYRRLTRGAFRKYILSFGIFYLLHLIGLLYASNTGNGLFKLEVKLSLIIFPLVISTMRIWIFNQRNVINIFVAFILGCLLGTLINLEVAVEKYLLTFNSEVFYYKYVSFFHHPGYFSMYLTMAVAILIFFLLKKDEYRLGAWHLISFTTLIIYFSFFIILLSSKAGILSLMVVYFITIGYFVVLERRVVQGIVLLAIIFTLFYTSLRIFPYSLGRIITSQEVLESADNIESSTTEGTGERILIWSSAFEIIRGHFLLGVGTGDVEDHLLQKYREYNIREALRQHLNAHNQYLQTFIGLGIFGFLVLMFMLILPAYYALKHQSFLYFIFLIIMAVNLLVESMFETQAGVVFYAFFNAFLFFNVKKTELGPGNHVNKKRRS